MIKKIKKNYFSKGFTLTELLVSITIILIVIGAAYSGYFLSQKAYREGEAAAELSQNGRVILERITREIRQAKDIPTELSEEEPAEEISPLDGIIFEDGHIEDPYHYIHYFKDNNYLKREVIAYYFSDNPGVWVPFGAVPPGGQTLETETLDDPAIVGEYLTGLKFWNSGAINVFLTLERDDKIVSLRTKIFGRNL